MNFFYNPFLSTNTSKMPPKTAIFNKTGRQIQQVEPHNMEDMVVLSVRDPEPVQPPDLDVDVCDDPNTPFIDESLPLPQMRHQLYEHERRKRFWKYTKWGILAMLVLTICILGYLVRNLNKVINTVSLNWSDSVIHNDEFNECIVIDKVNLSFDFQNEGWFSGVFNKGFKYDVVDSTSFELINKPSWFSWVRTYEPLAIVDTNGLSDTFRVVDHQYRIKLKDTNVQLYEEAHRFLNDLLGQRGKAEILIKTKVKLWDKITIPVRSKVTINKTSLNGILEEVLNDVIIHNLKFCEYNEDVISGHALVGLKPLRGIELDKFKIPANQLHLGAKIKGKFIKLITIESEEFIINDTMNDMVFKIPKVDEQLVKSGFIQKLINDVEKSEKVRLWLRAGYCKDNWLCDVIHGTEIEIPIDPMMFSNLDESQKNFDLGVETLSVKSTNDQINLDSIFEITPQGLNIPFNANFSGDFTFNGLAISVDRLKPLMLNSDNETISIEFNNMAVKIANESAILESINSIINGTAPFLELGFNLQSQIQSDIINGGFKFNSKKTINLTYDEMIPSLDGNFSAHLETVEVIEHSNETLIMIAHINVTNPLPFDIINGVEEVILNVEYSLGTHISSVTIFPFKLARSDWGVIDVGVKLNDGSPVAKHHMEEFIGKFMSSENVHFGLRGGSLSGSTKFTHLMEKVLVPVSIKNGTLNGANEFILDTTMHLFGKSVEVTVLNPIEEMEIALTISEAHANYEGELVGEIPQPQHLKVPSGVYKTPAMPVEFADSGVGWRVVKEALQSGKVVPVDVVALLQVHIGDYYLDLLYRGQRVLSKIRI